MRFDRAKVGSEDLPGHTARATQHSTRHVASHRIAAQRNARQRTASQRNATHRTAAQRSATHRSAPQRTASQRKATHRTAPLPTSPLPTSPLPTAPHRTARTARTARNLLELPHASKHETMLVQPRAVRTAETYDHTHGYRLRQMHRGAMKHTYSCVGVLGFTHASPCTA